MTGMIYRKLLETWTQLETLKNKGIKKVPPFYYIGERKCQILHSRLRLGCSSLNNDLFLNHLRDNNKCTCGSPETATHFFFECTNYDTVRISTLNQIPYQINTDILLFGCPLYDNETNGEIFRHVHTFIVRSKRFD